MEFIHEREPKGIILVFEETFAFIQRENENAKRKDPSMSCQQMCNIYNSFFMTSQKNIVSKVLFCWKMELFNNYRFIQYKVCGFWKTQQNQQQNIPHLATTLVSHKEFLELLALCNKK